MAKFAAEEGIKPLVWVPEMWLASDRAALYSRTDHILIPVDGNLLDQWQEVMRCKSRGETLRRLLDPDKPKIIFTNPDILFLILGLQYHADPFEALRRYETLILDEFHLERDPPRKSTADGHRGRPLPFRRDVIHERS